MSTRIEWATTDQGVELFGPDDDVSDAYGTTIDDGNHGLLICGGSDCIVIEGPLDDIAAWAQSILDQVAVERAKEAGQ